MRLRLAPACVALALSASGLAGCVPLARRAPADAPRGQLTRAVASADAVRVRSGGMLGIVGMQHETLAEVRGRDALAELAASIEVDWRQRPGSCCTPGHPTLELTQGGAPVATLAVIGDCDALRWAEDPSWRSDLILTPWSRLALADWLAAHGVPDPKTPPGPLGGAPRR